VLVQRLAHPRRLRVRAVSRAFAAPLAFGASFGFAVASTGCVSKVNFDRVVVDAAKAQSEAEQKQKDAEAKEKDDQTQIATLQQGLASAEAASQECDGKLSELSTSSHNLQAQLDEATAINQQLRDELGRLGKDVDKILADRGTLSKALDDAKLRLDELRKAQASRSRPPRRRRARDASS
jgi:chromosome segregation ATPase